MYGLMGKLKTHPGKRDEMVGHLLEAVKVMRGMAGCYVYVVSHATDDPDTIWVTEIWETKEAHDASLGHEAVKAAIAAGRSLIAEPPYGFEIEPIGGVGVPEN